ncbi:hypothetical protein EMCG_07746 [[Emmonsia] crescens]|uniref:Uncharacterized protein n=1 Tax=[Emmonsia] crescens TaxID=73230 RepID=A0A0G2I7D0_9EURO|nr:hypothetical protein EMCG_07746 [Emmonsia crescens UAMH 3008]
MQVYYVHDLTLSSMNPSVTPSIKQCLREMYKAHVFYFNDDIYITSEKKLNVPGVQNMSLTYSCADESFLYAAATGQKASSAVELAYMNIIQSRGLKKKFKDFCERRDKTAKEALEALSQAWSSLLEEFNQVHRRLLGKVELLDSTTLKEDLAYMVDAMIDALDKIWQLPELLFITDSDYLSDCFRRMSFISWSFCKAKETKSLCDLLSLADLLMEVKEEFRHDLVKIHTKLTILDT